MKGEWELYLGLLTVFEVNYMLNATPSPIRIRWWGKPVELRSNSMCIVVSQKKNSMCIVKKKILNEVDD